MTKDYIIRNARKEEHKAIGHLLVQAYSQLKGFPTPTDQPKYYHKLQHIHRLLTDDSIELIVAIDEEERVLGAVLFFGDMRYYGSKGAAMDVKNAAGFRFLGVSPDAQGLGIGKALSIACINRAEQMDLKKVIIHSTEAMKTAWKLYLKLWFQRVHALDFSWDGYGVYGFELDLEKKNAVSAYN